MLKEKDGVLEEGVQVSILSTTGKMSSVVHRKVQILPFIREANLEKRLLVM